MRAGNPALACTLCFYLPAKTNFVFDQQFDDFPIMRNISAQPPQFPARLPRFPGSETFLNSHPISRPVAPISGQLNYHPGNESFFAITNHIPNRKSRTAAGKFVNRRKRK